MVEIHTHGVEASLNSRADPSDLNAVAELLRDEVGAGLSDADVAFGSHSTASAETAKVREPSSTDRGRQPESTGGTGLGVDVLGVDLRLGSHENVRRRAEGGHTSGRPRVGVVELDGPHTKLAERLLALLDGGPRLYGPADGAVLVAFRTAAVHDTVPVSTPLGGGAKDHRRVAVTGATTVARREVRAATAAAAAVIVIRVVVVTSHARHGVVVA